MNDKALEDKARRVSREFLAGQEQVFLVGIALDALREVAEEARFEAEKQGCWACPGKEHRAQVAEAEVARLVASSRSAAATR